MTLRRPAFALLVLWLVPSFAQDYSVPSQWNASSPLSFDQRIHLFQGALEAVNTSYDDTQGLITNMGFSENANLVSATAIFDRIVSGRDNYDAISDHLSRVRPKLIPLSQSIASNDLLMWGLAEIYSFRAYGDRLFFLDAVSIWEQYTPWMITTQDAASGSHPLRNVTFPSQCNGSSVAGGVFVSHDDGSKASLGVIASTQGAYMALSAYLYEITRNQTYYDSANLSHTFIQSHLYNASRGCIMDNYDIQQCQTGNDWAFTYDTGLYLEGISVFANTTKDSGLIQLADQIALDSMKKSSLWTNVNGVITESRSNVKNDDVGHSFKGMLIRALHEHWSRSVNGSGISNLTEGFLTVQHNAILNSAKYPGSNWYTPTWVGPPVSTMLPWGQLAAMDVLSSAISFAANTTDTDTSTNTNSPNASSSPTSQQSSSSHKTPLGAIIGGALGGSLLLILVIGIIFMRLRTRRSAALTRVTGYKPELLGETAGRGSSDPLQSIDPFPPPFPVIEHFHVSKLHNEYRQPASSVPQSISQPSSSSGVTHLSTPSRDRPSESSGSRQDSIPELMHRLNRALASLPEGTEGAPVNAPPRYEDV